MRTGTTSRAHIIFLESLRSERSLPIAWVCPGKLTRCQARVPYIQWPIGHGAVGRAQTGGLLPRGQLLYQLSYSGIDFPALQPGAGTISCHGGRSRARWFRVTGKKKGCSMTLSCPAEQRLAFALSDNTSVTYFNRV